MFSSRRRHLLCLLAHNIFVLFRHGFDDAILVMTYVLKKKGESEVGTHLYSICFGKTKETNKHNCFSPWLILLQIKLCNYVFMKMIEFDERDQSLNAYFIIPSVFWAICCFP